MWNRKAAVSGLAVLAVAVAGACADTSVTEPAIENDYAALFSGGVPENPDAVTLGLDAEFVSIAQEIPGFAGFYYDANGALNVVMAPTARPLAEAEVQSRLAPRLQAMGENPSAVHGAIFHAGEYDFIELEALHRRVQNVLSIAGTVYTDADEVANRVAVGVENAQVAAAVEHALAMLDVPREAVVIRERPPFQPTVGQGEVGRMNLGGFVRPVAGGLQIQGNGLCTLGFNVRSATFPAQGFVTTHHCTQTPGVVTNQQFWQPTAAAANRIGVEVRDTMFTVGGACPAGQRCRRSASAGAAYHTGVNNAFARIYRTIPGTNQIDPNNPMFHITAERSFPSVGNVMHKVGATTGWTQGTVSQSCVAVTVAPDLRYNCQEITTGAAGFFAGADGGAPVFEPTPGGGPDDVRLVGMAWGQSAANDYVWSAMIEIRSDNPARPAAQGGPWRTFPPPPAP
jgi:hypothetical protein